MDCPKCHKPVGENDAVCKNCGLVLREEAAKPKKAGLLGKRSSERKKDKTELSFVRPVKRDGGELSAPGRTAFDKIRLGIIALIVIAVAVVVIVIILHFVSSGGEKTAEKLSEYINKPMSIAEDKVEIHLKEESAFDGVNNAVKFDYIYEADDDVKIDDVKYPEWSVGVNVDEDDDITSVTYTDFTVLEKNHKGIKRDGLINKDDFESGDKLKNVLSEIGLDAYSITYQIIGKTYVFKYYYTLDNGDARAVILTAVFDDDDRLDYVTSRFVFPSDM